MRDRPPALGDIRRYNVSPSAKYAWWQEFQGWVRGFRTSYAEHWPDEGKVTNVQLAHGRRIKAFKSGWPMCWAQHRGFVDNLVAVREHENALLRGAEWAGGVKGWEDLARYVQECVAVSVRLIRERCADGHVDKTTLYNQDFGEAEREHNARLAVELGL